MALSFTEGAAEAVRRMIDERGGGLGIRLIVEPSECSGLAYRLQFVDELAEDDCVHESFGTRLVVDRKSLVWLDGTEIDFEQEGDANGFDIRNPNATRQCGCRDNFYS